MYAAMLDKKLVLAVSEAYLVNSRQKKLNQEIYRCPHCNKKVILIVSEKKSAFFKHLTSYTNLMGEKEEHHQSKMLFKAALTAAGFIAAVLLFDRMAQHLANIAESDLSLTISTGTLGLIAAAQLFAALIIVYTFARILTACVNKCSRRE